MRTFFPATIRGRKSAEDDILPEGTTAKDLICGADDLKKLFTHNEIGGVRRVTQILFSSQKANEELSTDIGIQRSFIYQMTDPYDLVSIEDQVVAL